MPSFSHDEVKLLKLKFEKWFLWPYGCCVVWLDIADLSDHGPGVAAKGNRAFSSNFGKNFGKKMIHLTTKLGEINNIEYNQGSKICPQNQVI